jgi:hypothetical protein
MRTRHAHLAMGVRVDMPFFALNNDVNDVVGSGYANGSAPPTVQRTLYYVPVSIEARLTF